MIINGVIGGSSTTQQGNEKRGTHLGGETPNSHRKCDADDRKELKFIRLNRLSVEPSGGIR
jgi:hypothetical protein